MKKVLVWHQGALGDLILSLPAVYAIKKHAEGVSLHLICREDLSTVILRNNLAEEVTSNEKGAFGCLFSEREHHSPDLRAFLAGFDDAFVFMRSRNALFLDNIQCYIPQCHYIRTFPPPDVRVHVSRYQLDQLDDTGIGKGEKFPVLDAGGKTSFSADPPVIVVHPGSGGRKKCWPLRRYMRLMEELHREDESSFIVILGPAEESGEYETLREFISERRICADIMRNMPVSEIVRVLKKAALFIGNDSGITHLASALGTPSLVIFGPTDHEIWKPLGANVRIVRSGYSCSPCEEEDRRRCTGVKCLEALPVETVLAESRRVRRVR
jgi:ADP-heptose:LPS heptosyltransferase